MAINVGGKGGGGLGQPFRKHRFRHQATQGFKELTPYDARTGQNTPLNPNVIVKVGVTDNEIPVYEFTEGYSDTGVVSVWERGQQTDENLYVRLDWPRDTTPIAKDTDVICVKFVNEKIWRVFRFDPPSILLKRCTDDLPLIVQDVFLSEELGWLSDHIDDDNPKVVRLKATALLESACWEIISTSTCKPSLCPTVLTLMDDCSECDNCWTLTQCEYPYAVKVVKPDQLNNNDFAINDGDIILLDDGYCYEAKEADACDDYEDVTILAKIASCDYCLQCFKLKTCHGSTVTYRYIYADDHAIAVGDYTKLDGVCYEVIEKDACAELTNDEPERIADVLPVYDNCDECGCYLLVSCPDGTGIDLVAKSAIDADGDALDLSEYLGKIVMLDTGYCYTVTASNDDCYDSEDVVVLESYDECSYCQSYVLVPCAGGSNVTTYSDLSEEYVGNHWIVRLESDGLCYRIDSTTTYSPTDVAVVVTESFDSSDCLDCTAPKYHLTPDCPSCEDTYGDTTCDADGGDATVVAGGGTAKITDYDFSASVGQYVKLSDGICYAVTLASNGDTLTTPAVTGSDGTFATCVACQRTCLWVVELVYTDTGYIKQTRKKIVVDQICEEEEAEIAESGVC